jgi:hypothetical protein
VLWICGNGAIGDEMNDFDWLMAHKYSSPDKVFVSGFLWRQKFVGSTEKSNTRETP